MDWHAQRRTVGDVDVEMKAGGRGKAECISHLKKYGGQFGAAFCVPFFSLFFKSPFLWVPKADWRLLVIFHKMWVCVR